MLMALLDWYIVWNNHTFITISYTNCFVCPQSVLFKPVLVGKLPIHTKYWSGTGSSGHVRLLLTGIARILIMNVCFFIFFRLA